MQISGITQFNNYNGANYLSKKNSPNFQANPNSPILNFHKTDFFINIKGYGKNKDWAAVIKKTADKAVTLITSDKSSDDVLKEIIKGVKNANSFCRDIKIRQHTGILRTERRGFGKPGAWKDIELTTPISDKYISYEKKLLNINNLQLKSPFWDIVTAKIEPIDRIDYVAKVVHPSGEFVNNALDRIGGKYFNLKKEFISQPEKVTEETLPKINSDIAEIRWILAHSMPWERGSDSISNVFTRSLYKSMGIKTYPLKKGITLDLEAFCTPLNEYKKNFASYFEQAPQVVE